MERRRRRKRRRRERRKSAGLRFGACPILAPSRDPGAEFKITELSQL